MTICGTKYTGRKHPILSNTDKWTDISHYYTRSCVNNNKENRMLILHFKNYDPCLEWYQNQSVLSVLRTRSCVAKNIWVCDTIGCIFYILGSFRSLKILTFDQKISR